VLAETVRTKKCPRCGEIKPLSSFNKDKAQKDGHRNICKICQRLHHKEYYQNNRGRESQRRKKYYQNNRDKELQRCKEHRKNNPDKTRAQYARKRAAKRNATPPWVDKAAIEAIYAEAVWLQDFTGEPYHVDHIVPLKSDFVCGLHVPANLQTLPGAENIAKSNRSWPEQLSCQTRRGIDHQWWKELYARTIALEE